MKYVRLRNLRTGEEIIVMCLAPVTHAQVSDSFAQRGFERVSAGFVKVDPFAPLGIQILGQSDSLGLKPQADDAELISMLYGATLGLVGRAPAHGANQPGDDAIVS
jgi:hypothetical protein